MTESTPLDAPSAFAVFRHRSFRRLWLAQFVSTSGDALTLLAASIFVFRLTGSALSVGLMMVSTAAPSLFIGLLAGVFVDRYDRRKIMMIADFTRAVLVFLLPFLVPFHIAWLYIIVALIAMLGTFFNPAHESVLPEIATDEELAAANSFIAISSFGSTAVGFALSGIITSLASIDVAFYLDSLTFLISALLIASIRIPHTAVSETTNIRTVIRNLQDGFNYLRELTILRSTLIVMAMIYLSFGLWNALLLPFTSRILGADELVFGIQEGLTSVGFILGSLVMVNIANRLREGQWIAIGMLGMGVLWLTYANTTSIPVAILLVFLAGLLNPLMSVGRRLIIQRNTTREIRGRITSVFLVAANVAFIVGMSAAGLADIVDIRVMMMAAALIATAAGLLSFVIPGLRQSAAQWGRSIVLLRQIEVAPGLAPGRAATSADLELLATHLPAFALLSDKQRRILASQMWVQEAAEGTAILRQNQVSDDAYFILDGRTAVGRQENGRNRLLEKLNAGDFFGEIAALTSAPRTANVIADVPTRLLQVPASTLREMTKVPELNRLLVSKMTERMVILNMVDISLFGGLNQQSLRDLRTA